MVLDRLLDIAYEIVGDEAGQVIEFLYHNPGASEFDVSENIGFTVSQVRSILYELKAKNLIDYDRKKDKEKGWYLYYWKVIPQNFETVYMNEKKTKLAQFKERLETEETSIYYICPNFCKRLSFDDSLEHNFTCPVCGSLMNEENKSRKIEMLKRNIKEHEGMINDVPSGSNI
jgi:transcription initiation factor TFIIE subunit alpha